MRKYKMRIIVLAMIAALLGGCGNADSKETTKSNSEQGTDSAKSQETDSPLILPDFACTDMEGNQVSSAIFSESKLTMVNVWATYCNPCLSEMPGLGELAKEYDPAEFQVIGIISDVLEDGEEETAELAKGLIQQTKADYTHLLLNESVYKALLTDVTAVPTTFFVDENGAVLDVVVGAMEKEAWEERINGLLEE